MGDIAIIEKGGIVMMVLIAMSIYALAVVFYKIFQLYQSGVFSGDFIEPVMTEVKKGELTAAEYKLQSAYGPIAIVMKVAIVCITNRLMSQKSREAEISRVGSAEIRRLERHMRGLEMVSTTAPLLGLLGTVMGMVRAFHKLGEAGSRVDPAMLAGGIWEALLTTVGGLVVAIPAVIAYYVIDGVIERVRATMNDVTVQILALEDEFLRNEAEVKRREAEIQRNAEKKEAKEEQAERERREEERQQRFIKEIKEYEKALEVEKDTEKRKEIKKAIEEAKSMPQNSSTLRLLSPSYKNF